ncbi:MAG: antirestriction protein ArdA [Cellvibrionaceae bacterium]|nr:antirestriction protein ArdA [Cellvibrionaceae bacterium]
MPKLYAQPYNLAATGFYFESYEAFQTSSKGHVCMFGTPVEEYQIQFIDGDHIDCELAKAWGINQANISGYLNACDSWDDHDKTVFIIAVGEVGYSFDPDSVAPSDFDVDIYHVGSMKELPEQFIDEGLFGDIPEHLSHYIDMEAIARDLAMDYTEAQIAGEWLIYRAA